MFISFIRPARRELLISFIILAVLLFGGRFLAFAGSTWNALTCAGTAIIFAVLATRLRAVRSLDVPLRTWFSGLLASAAIWSMLLGVIGTATATLNQHLSPWYALYDDFLITSGPAYPLDTNGIPYFMADAGQSVSSVLLTLLVYFFAFLAAAGVGALIGMIRIRSNAVLTVLAVGVLVIGLLAFAILLPGNARLTIPDQSYVTAFSNQGYAELFLIAGIPVALIGFLLAWWAARRIEV
ncbi:hypothetical protein COCCU_02920 [Corynebacterium occultum]|uniref:ABC-2 family transporter protein n=1 Tax=Corynebacterium occultum TaxID=2675219 RepID=A0A6B8WJ69_9CORY|nr:hypothetical protein [Corynebacterium occultum]QGU06538.1 hypothetical protein COCCU_02920 [Corynebacterium occultum]